MKRIENFGITFKDGLAEGWAFSVLEAFREQLDIVHTEYVDKERSRQLRKICPRNEDGSLPTVYRTAWSRGVPPTLSFDVGHTFYDPPQARVMAWEDALKMLRRIVQVTEARPDELPGSGGWVKVELRYFEDGKTIRTESHNLSQAEFEGFLRTGQLPPGHEDFAPEPVDEFPELVKEDA
jgi:hypothetical protein